MWHLGFVMNVAISVAYVGIAYAIGRSLAETRQIRTNRLGAAIGAIFLTCAAGHFVHAWHLLAPSFGMDLHHGLHARQAMEWHLVAVDLVTAGVGAYYWALRRNYPAMVRGAKLFEDLRERRQAALRINDSVVQRLVVAQLAIEQGDDDRARDEIRGCLRSLQSMVAHTLAESPDDRSLSSGPKNPRALDVVA